MSVLTCLVCLMVYHKITERQFVEIENDFARLVVKSESSKDNSLEDYARNLPRDFIAPSAFALDAVVSIKAVSVKGNNWRNKKYTKSNGSGVIVSSNGYIITNYHVVEDADNIEATLENKREYACEIVGYDRSTDLALLKIDAAELRYLQFGDSDSLIVGEWVLAVGNPFKLQSSVTAGIVSAKARDINIFNRQGVESFIQTDAAINPGSSGGALINTKGELVGINTAILTYSGKYEGFSFAIPSSIVKKVINDIREYGAVQRAWLGVGINNVDDNIAQERGLIDVNGVYIDLVERDGAANEAGLKSGDIIVSIEGKTCNSTPEFLELMGQYSPGDKINIAYFRDERKKLTSAILRNQLNSTDYIAVRKDKVLTDLGFELRDLDTREKDRLNIEGIMVVSIISDSKIDKTNMDPSYIITHINKKPINSVTDFVNIIKEAEGRIKLEGLYENYPGEYPYEFYK